MNLSREFDIIVWGASGFTGRLVVLYLFNKYGVTGDLKWAMGGRNLIKLKKVRDEVANKDVPLIIADSDDKVSLMNMVNRTKVICTTVGPYAKYGSNLVEACIKSHIHYCDLAGEVQWIHKMINNHHSSAIINGSKIVHTCGFDSIPSDMGVYFIQRESKDKKGIKALEIKMRVAALSGGISGGTYASLSRVLEESQRDKMVYKVLINPYGLNPLEDQFGEDKSDLKSVIFDNASQSWIGPFVMASINTKVVRRSNSLSNHSYGKNFRYDEGTIFGKGLFGRIKGIISTVLIGLIMYAKHGSLLKKVLDRFFPNPGEGPTSKKIEKGFYNLRFYITLDDGSNAFAKVTGDMDPGYGSTSKMLAESAVCLAKDKLPNKSGVLTPSVAMGDSLLTRLEKNAGLKFSFEF
ncbi:saccharopine dehydrogenase NADP-binding domain-containing protein [Flavobacteriaceae bacterium]|nr:saccharopine dehydrogenase NADP-binding domain-containing protein [Flavobacteriaceae bacterium]